jgi:hypothetical protein
MEQIFHTPAGLFQSWRQWCVFVFDFTEYLVRTLEPCSLEGAVYSVLAFYACAFPTTTFLLFFVRDFVLLILRNIIIVIPLVGYSSSCLGLYDWSLYLGFVLGYCPEGWSCPFLISLLANVYLLRIIARKYYRLGWSCRRDPGRGAILPKNAQSAHVFLTKQTKLSVI